MKRVWTAWILNDHDMNPGELTKVVRANDLGLPIHIALGAFESASTEELDELIADLKAERARR